MKTALVILSIVAFLLAAFGVATLLQVSLVPLGLALFAGSFLPWKS